MTYKAHDFGYAANIKPNDTVKILSQQTYDEGKDVEVTNGYTTDIMDFADLEPIYSTEAVDCVATVRFRSVTLRIEDEFYRILNDEYGLNNREQTGFDLNDAIQQLTKKAKLFGIDLIVNISSEINLV